jgi:hypothetical protein
METLQAPLSKIQLELLSMFNNKSISDEEWGFIKGVIADFFAKKSIEAADKAWDENEWDEAKVEQILKSHLRTPYNPGNQLG